MRLRRAVVRSSRFLMTIAIAAAVVGLLLGVERVISLTRAWHSVERVSLSTEPSQTGTDEDPLPPQVRAARAGHGDQGQSSPHHDDGRFPLAAPSESHSPDRSETSRATQESPTTTASAGGPPLSTSTSTSTHTGIDIEGTTTTTPSTSTTPPERPSVVALVGSDSRSGLEDRSHFGDFEGRRADVILLAIRTGGEVTLLSLPRDLYVRDTCHGGRHRIGEAFSECGDVHALANLVAELELVTGVDVDHAASVDLAGFQSVVDELGGYEICTDHALRDDKSGLVLEPGCTHADGATTLAWLRSRNTERRRDGDWRPVPASSDLLRNERQRRFLVDMVDQLTADSGPGAIHDALRSIAPHLTIDDQLSLSDAAAWAWTMRDADVETAEIPVADRVTAGGAAVLAPTVDIPSFVDEATR